MVDRLICDCLPELMLSNSSEFFSDKFLGIRILETYLKWVTLMDGVMEYRKLLSTNQKSVEFREEERWILDNDQGWEFSFVNLCNEFGITPVTLRTALVCHKKSPH